MECKLTNFRALEREAFRFLRHRDPAIPWPAAAVPLTREQFLPHAPERLAALGESWRRIRVPDLQWTVGLGFDVQTPNRSTHLHADLPGTASTWTSSGSSRGVHCRASRASSSRGARSLRRAASGPIPRPAGRGTGRSGSSSRRARCSRCPGASWSWPRRSRRSRWRCGSGAGEGGTAKSGCGRQPVTTRDRCTADARSGAYRSSAAAVSSTSSVELRGNTTAGTRCAVTAPSPGADGRARDQHESVHGCSSEAFATHPAPAAAHPASPRGSRSRRRATRSNASDLRQPIHRVPIVLDQAKEQRRLGVPLCRIGC